MHSSTNGCNPFVILIYLQHPGTLGLWLLSARAAAAINLTRRKARAVLVLWGLWVTAALFDALNNGFDGLDKHAAVGFHSLTLPSGPSCRRHLPALGPPVGSWLQ